MAEAFGVAAGAIGVVSLSIQLAESLQKVKSFYAAVKNAPPQVEELIEEIEVMQDILSDLELGSQSATAASSPNMQRCMKVAQRATKGFATFSGELQNRIKKSRFRGGVKFALSREDIKQMLDQLERTKSSLNLAYSLYQQATAEDRHVALISVVANSQGVATTTTQTSQIILPAQDTVVLTRNASQLSAHKLSRNRRLFQMTTPEWVSNTVLQFEMTHSITGLNIMLRTYGIVPYNAPVFRACEEGDVVEMQRLFDKKLASPFDRDVWGRSLWDAAADNTSMDSLRFLAQYGTASHSSSFSLSSTLDNSHFYSLLRADRGPALNIGRSLREDMIWLHDTWDTWDDTGDGSLELPLGQDTARLLRCSPEDADSVWFWQCMEWTTPSQWQTCSSKETYKDMLNRYVPELHGSKTPLQLAAVAIADLMGLSSDGPPQGLEKLVAAIIASGADLHDADHYHTPLLLLLATVPGEKLYDWPWGYRNLRKTLISWLTILQRAGVDLVAYGAKESRRFSKYRSMKNPVPPLQYWHNSNPYAFSDEVFYFTFAYGPTPKDWTVQLDMAEQYVGDFWQMPGLLDDSRIRAVPGAWIDGP